MDKIKKTKIYKWINERYAIDGLFDFFAKKEVVFGVGKSGELYHKMKFGNWLFHTAKRHYIWYYFGGITLFLFMVLVVSGIMLLMYYQNGEGTAYESVRYIMERVPYGGAVRSIHSWAANLMIVAAFIHMFSVFFTKAYRQKKELTWVTGFMMLLLAMGAGFSGYLLPWTSLSFFAVSIGTELMEALPFVGEWMLEVARGGKDVSANTLHRFLGLHVTIIPIGLIMLIGLHLLFIQRQGTSKPMNMEKEKEEIEKVGGDTSINSMKFFPDFALRDVWIWFIVFNVLVLLAVFFPWELGEKADPLTSAPPNIKPEWFFLAMFVVLELVPKEVGIALFTIVGLMWVSIPFWDTKAKRDESSKFVFIFGLCIFVGFIVFTIIGFVYTTEQISGFAQKYQLTIWILFGIAFFALLITIIIRIIRAMRNKRNQNK